MNLFLTFQTPVFFLNKALLIHNHRNFLLLPINRGGSYYNNVTVTRMPEIRRPLGRPRRRWVDNIKMDLGEVGWGDVDWIGLAKDRNRWRAVVNSVLNLRVS
jgi:hypothetical protein